MLLELHGKYIYMPQEKECVARETESSADRAIDRLVYELSPKGDNNMG